MNLSTTIKDIPCKVRNGYSVNYQGGYKAGHQSALRAASELAGKREEELRQQIAAAMRFVPQPCDMSGYDDPDAPEEVRELIAMAEWLHGIEAAREAVK